MNRKLVLVVLIGLAILIAVSGLFYGYVGLDKLISSTGSDWSNFGSYFGGVAGSFFAFLSVLLIVYTIHQQSEAIELNRREAEKLDLIRHLSRADEEIEQWLKIELASKAEGKTVPFGLIVWKIVPASNVNVEEFKLSCKRLLKLVCSYCSAIALYEDNVDPYFIYKNHYQKAQGLLDFLEKQQGHLSQMDGPSIGNCRHLLEKGSGSDA